MSLHRFRTVDFRLLSISNDPLRPIVPEKPADGEEARAEDRHDQQSAMESGWRLKGDMFAGHARRKCLRGDTSETAGE